MASYLPRPSSDDAVDTSGLMPLWHLGYPMTHDRDVSPRFAERDMALAAHGCFHEECAAVAFGGDVGGSTGFCRFAIETLWRVVAEAARAAR